MSKRILVAVWKTEHYERHSALGSGERMALLAQALAAAHRAAAAQCIPGSQRLRVILVVPEYYFAQRDAAAWNGADFCPRSLSEDERDDIVHGLEQLSRKHPSILFIPGTIAWKQARHTPRTPGRRRHGRTRKATAIHDLQRYQELLADSGMEELQPAKLSPQLRKAVTEQVARDKAARAKAKAKAKAEQDESDEDDGENKNDNDGVDIEAPHIAGPVLSELVESGVLPGTSMYVSPSPDDKLQELKLPSKDSKYHHLMRNTAYILFNGRVQFKYHKNADYHEAIGDADTVFIPGGKIGTCQIAGIRFGIEICFDHTMAMLGTGIAQHTGRGNPMVPPTIHIVTSDSTDSVTANYQVRDQGYFVHASTDTDTSTVVQRQGGCYKDVKAVVHNPDRNPQSRIGGYPLSLWVITV